MPGGWITAQVSDRIMASTAPAGGIRRTWPPPAGLGRLADGRGGPVEDPVAVFRSAVGAALAWGGERGPGCGPDCVMGCAGAGQSRMFQAVPGQVRAVREFVRSALPGRAAADDAVAVASGLATNTVAHSGSGRVGGVFTVHVTALGPDAAGLAVTELRGGGFPEVQDAGPEAASGRGLAIVQALTKLFWVSDGAEIRILLATIPAPAERER